MESRQTGRIDPLMLQAAVDRAGRAVGVFDVEVLNQIAVCCEGGPRPLSRFDLSIIMGKPERKVLRAIESLLAAGLIVVEPREGAMPIYHVITDPHPSKPQAPSPKPQAPSLFSSDDQHE